MYNLPSAYLYEMGWFYEVRLRYNLILKLLSNSSKDRASWHDKLILITLGGIRVLKAGTYDHFSDTKKMSMLFGPTHPIFRKK